MNQVKLKTSFLFNTFCSHTLLIYQERLILSALKDAEKQNLLIVLLGPTPAMNLRLTLREIPQV